MASEQILDLDTLLAEIPGDNKAGEAEIPFEVKEELDTQRIEVDPADYDADDPRRPTEAKKADWAAVRRLATDTLTRTTKHLMLAARLTEAITHLHGFAGLGAGLGLMRQMLDQCWDRMYPAIPEDGDLDYRAVPLKWLGDSSKNVDFANTVRRVPLIGPYSWQTWKLVQDGRGTVSRDEFDKAQHAATYEECKQRFDDLTVCVDELTKLSQDMTAKMSSSAPGMTDLRSAIGECYTLAKQLLKQKEPEPTSEEGGAGGDDGGGGSAGRAISSRAEAYRRLAEAADLLERLEPHSPIPYLVRRAVELGALPFPQLMKALIRDDAVILAMNRELGIKEESSGY